MGSIIESFKAHKGLRGLHIFVNGDVEKYSGFLTWDKTFLFLKELGDEHLEEEFLKHMANYNPDTHALSLIQEPREQIIKLALYSF